MGRPHTADDSIRWLGSLPFLAAHLSVLAPILTGVSLRLVLLCLASFAVRMVWVTAGYHRYFSHRSFRTSRVGQFVLAFLAQTSSQKGALWWAAHHRAHHLYSDTERDIHSPVRRGFFYSHMGWIMVRRWEATDWPRIRDLAKYPELRFLNRYWGVPPLVYAAAMYAIAGWNGVLWGFLISTVLLWHGSFVINSLAHVFGRKRYETGDDSRNSALLALLTMGEGWHNNHHHFATTVRQGFFWWELDVTWYVLEALARVGLVWDLLKPPPKIVASGLVSQPAAEAPEELRRTKLRVEG
jgi:stearoyl-CoA desaturase (delta-9 desaturase)